MPPLIISKTSSHINLKFIGNMTKENFDSLSKAIVEGRELIKKTSIESGRHVDILLDMSDYGGSYDTGAIDMLAEFARNNREYVRKTACFGGSKAAVLAGEIVADVANRGNINFFASQKEAEGWLSQ